MLQPKVTLQRAKQASEALLRALSPLADALFPVRGNCPSCGREALWAEVVPGQFALCLKCRRALMEIFRWEEASYGKEARNGCTRIRGRVVQCAGLSSALASALASGGSMALGQAASAIASLIPLQHYFSIEGVYADAGGARGTSARLSPYARALASACEADFLGIISAGARTEDAFPYPVHGGRAEAKAPFCALVAMQGESSPQEEERIASRLSGTKWVICAYVGALWQEGREAVI